MPSDKTRSIFGTVHRERVLAALARGPLHVRALAREVGLGERGAWDVVERFRRAGVVTKRQRPDSYVLAALDPRFPAADELRSLLAVLHPESALPADRPARRWGLDAAPRGGSGFAGLFGSPMRTRLLVLLALVGETTPDRARRLLRQRRGQTLLDAVRFFHALGVVRWWHRGNAARISLDPRWPAHDALRRLLLRLADASPGIVRAVRAESAAPHDEHPPEEWLPFLRPAHARMLLDLRAGPLRIADFVGRRGITRATALATARELEACGLVAIGTVARHATVALDAAHADFAAWWTLMGIADPRAHPAEQPETPFTTVRVRRGAPPFHARTARIVFAAATGTAQADRPNEVLRVLDRLAPLGLLAHRDGRVALDERYASAVAAILSPPRR